MFVASQIWSGHGGVLGKAGIADGEVAIATSTADRGFAASHV